MSEDENAQAGRTNAGGARRASRISRISRISRTARLTGWLMISRQVLVLGIPASLIVTAAAGAETLSVTRCLFTCAVMALALAAVPPCRRMTAAVGGEPLPGVSENAFLTPARRRPGRAAPPPRPPPGPQAQPGRPPPQPRNSPAGTTRQSSSTPQPRNRPRGA